MSYNTNMQVEQIRISNIENLNIEIIDKALILTSKNTHVKETIQLHVEYKIKTHNTDTDETHNTDTDETHNTYTDETHNTDTDETHNTYTDETHNADTDETHNTDTDETHNTDTDETHNTDTDETYIEEYIQTQIKYTGQKHNKEDKKIYITEDDIIKELITHSKIKECTIKRGDEIISTNTSYRGNLINIWKTMPTQKILKNSTFNFKLTNDQYKNGYNWCRHINMAFQDKCATEVLKEIIHMVKLNKMSISLSIKLKTGNTVYFKTD